MKILSISYSFAYFYFFGFHEILKNKNTKDHFEHVLHHHSNASDYYISIVLPMSIFQLAGNCKPEFQAYESGRRTVEIQLGSMRDLKGG